MTRSRNITASWWKLVAVGGAMLAVLIVATSITGELHDPWWLVTMIVGLTAVLTTASGLALGVMRLRLNA